MTIKELEQEILKHKEAYYNSTPLISDAEYDALENELRQLDPNNPLLLNVGAMPSFGKKVTHKIPMGSLNKITYETTDDGKLVGDGLGLLQNWYDTHPHYIVWSYKIDGAAGELKYVNNKLIQASTRGNGRIGSDITDNIKTLKNIPKTLNLPKEFEDKEVLIRGEFYIPRSFFNKHLKDEAANPRNAVSGAIQHKNPQTTKTKGVEFQGYKVLINNKPLATYDLEAKFANLCGIQFVEVHHSKLNAKLIAELDEKRKHLSFDTDGLVLTINDREKREQYGYVGDNPKGSVAFKFKPEQAKTKIIDIEWNVGRTGRVTPIAIVEPVHLAGTTVQRCTLHNLDEIQKLNASIGSIVLMQKSGEIIPKIVKVIDASNNQPLNMPKQCPICKSNLRVERPMLICDNIDCEAKLLARVTHYLQTLDVKNIGTSTICDLIEHRKLKSIADLYILTKADLQCISMIGPKKVDIILSAIKSSQKTTLPMFLASLGIDGIGRTNSKKLAKKFKTIHNILNAKNIEFQEFGDKTSDLIYEGLQQNKNLISRLLQYVEIEEPKDSMNNVLNGVAFCFTGTLSQKRKWFEELIERNGGEISSVNKNLNYLIVGEYAGSKLNKAKKLGIVILSESEFFKKFNLEV